MSDNRLISADSHFVEPPTMWVERMDQRFRDRAPHTVKGLSGREGEFFVCENVTPMAVAGFFGAGVPSAELPEHNKRGFDAAPKSVWDPAFRLKDQDRDGVAGRSHLHLDGHAAVRTGRRRAAGGLLSRLQRLGDRVLQSRFQASDSARPDHARRYPWSGRGTRAHRKERHEGRDDLGGGARRAAV